jgi:hypothetical protein
MAIAPGGLECHPLHEEEFTRNTTVQDTIRANYNKSIYESVVRINSECEYQRSKHDPSQLTFHVPVENLCYEVICFASKKLVLEYYGHDRKRHAIELYSAHNYGEHRKNAPYAALCSVSAPGTKISIILRCKTKAPPMLHCTLTVFALGIWHREMKSWHELSDLEIENRMFKRLLYSVENLLSTFHRYNVAVNGSLILEKEQKGLHLSLAEQNASMDLHALLCLMRRVESTQV